jgi:hypothetical protein
MSSMSTISDSSPEVEGILRDILVFSDLQAQTSQQEELNMARSGASLDAMDIDSEESLRCKRPLILQKALFSIDYMQTDIALQQ